MPHATPQPLSRPELSRIAEALAPRSDPEVRAAIRQYHPDDRLKLLAAVVNARKHHEPRS